jgi:hypothetical protein
LIDIPNNRLYDIKTVCEDSDLHRNANSLVNSQGYFRHEGLCEKCMKLKVAMQRDNKIFMNPLRPSGNYMHHLLYQSVTVQFAFMGLTQFSV